MFFQVLELICTREAGAVFEAGGLQCSLTFIREFGSSVHKDTLHSAMNVVSRLCGRMEPQDTNLETCVKSLSTLLKHEDPYVSVYKFLTVIGHFRVAFYLFFKARVSADPLIQRSLLSKWMKM